MSLHNDPPTCPSCGADLAETKALNIFYDERIMSPGYLETYKPEGAGDEHKFGVIHWDQVMVERQIVAAECAKCHYTLLDDDMDIHRVSRFMTEWHDD